VRWAQRPLSAAFVRKQICRVEWLGCEPPFIFFFSFFFHFFPPLRKEGGGLNRGFCKDVRVRTSSRINPHRAVRSTAFGKPPSTRGVACRRWARSFPRKSGGERHRWLLRP